MSNEVPFKAVPDGSWLVCVADIRERVVKRLLILSITVSNAFRREVNHVSSGCEEKVGLTSPGEKQVT